MSLRDIFTYRDKIAYRTGEKSADEEEVYPPR